MWSLTPANCRRDWLFICNLLHLHADENYFSQTGFNKWSIHKQLTIYPAPVLFTFWISKGKGHESSLAGRRGKKCLQAIGSFFNLARYTSIELRSLGLIRRDCKTASLSPRQRTWSCFYLCWCRVKVIPSVLLVQNPSGWSQKCARTLGWSFLLLNLLVWQRVSWAAGAADPACRARSERGCKWSHVCIFSASSIISTCIVLLGRILKTAD